MFWRSFRFNRAAVLFIIGIISSLLLIFIRANIPLTSDQVDYHQMAAGLLDGKGFYSIAALDDIIAFPNARHPLYPFFIAVIYFFTNSSIIAVKITQGLIHGFTCVMVFRISEKIFKNKPTAFAAGLIWALYPLALIFTASLLYETLLTLLLALSVWYILRWKESPSPKNIFLSGLFLGLTALAKSIIFIFIPVLFVWFILSSKVRLLPKLRSFSLIILFMFLTVSPWAVRNYIVLKTPFPFSTASGLSFYWYNNEKTLEIINDPLRFVSAFTEEEKKKLSGLSEREADKYLYNLGWQFIKAHPGFLLKKTFIETYHFWHLLPSPPERYAEYYLREKKLGIQNYVFEKFLGRFKNTWFLYFCKLLYHMPYDILFLGMLASLIGSFKKDKIQWEKSMLLFLLIATVNFVYIFHHGTDRYRLPIDPYVFILGFHGAKSFYNNLRKGKEK